MIKRVGKRGDTLIEVMLAVGIFSMVAVAVVAVMSGGTSSAQTALETTLTREEIDAQAEALRFIQTSYISDKASGNDSDYSKLWKYITSKAYNYEHYNESDNISQDLSQYSPASCSDLYDSSSGEAKAHGFILNTKKLNSFNAINDVVADGDSLQPATTYPHLVFWDGFSLSSDEEKLVDDKFTTLKQAEGIYIIAVKDPESTTIAGSGGTKESAYYDFYIRTCWYGTGDQAPSTISTVIRLYDPDAIKEINDYGEANDGERDYSIILHLNAGSLQLANGDIIESKSTVNPDGTINKNQDFYSVPCAPSATSCKIPGNNMARSGYRFLGWCSVETHNSGCDGKIYNFGDEVIDKRGKRGSINLYAMWSEHNVTYKITLDWSGSSYQDLDSYIHGQKSNGAPFTTSYGSAVGGDTDEEGKAIIISRLLEDCMGGSCTDRTFTKYLLSGEQEQVLRLPQYDINVAKREYFIINTLSGKDYYFYVRNWSSDSSIIGDKVTVTISERETSRDQATACSIGDNIESDICIRQYVLNELEASGYHNVKKFTANCSLENRRFWNVFAYKNGRFITPPSSEICSNTALTNY